MGLNAQRVTLTRGGARVLHDVDACLTRGRVTAILGPNGAGKTSLLKLLAGLATPDSGAVLIDDTALSTLAVAARARVIGYLPQQANVAWDVTARDVVALGRVPHRSAFAAPTEADAAAIAAALVACDVEALAARRILSLSGGERARVMVARVLAGDPEWMLVDEPLASLDPAHQQGMLRLFAAAARRGAGVGIVLHDLSQAAHVADDVVLLREGRVVAAGPTREVLTAERLRTVYGIDFAVAEGADGMMIRPIF